VRSCEDEGLRQKRTRTITTLIIMPKILLIEDDERFRSIMKKVLESHGFEILEADGAPTGVRLAQEQLPDLILSDVNMQEGDGYAVLVVLRESKRTQAIPLILITGQPSLAGMRRGMEQGADDYLVKPFSFEAMIATVNARLRKYHAIEEQIQSQIADHHSFLNPTEISQDSSWR